MGGATQQSWLDSRQCNRISSAVKSPITSVRPTKSVIYLVPGAAFSGVKRFCTEVRNKCTYISIHANSFMASTGKTLVDFTFLGDSK